MSDKRKKSPITEHNTPYTAGIWVAGFCFLVLFVVVSCNFAGVI